MDTLTLATTVVNLLIPYLAKLGEEVAEIAIDETKSRLKGILAAVKAKFSGNVYAEETLKRVEEHPQSQGRQAALVGVLEEQIQADPSFADMLSTLVDAAKKSETDVITQRVTVSGHARTGDINTFGKVEGNVDLRKKK